MSAAPFDLLLAAIRGDPDEDRLREALVSVQTSALDVADQAAALEMLARVLSIVPDPDQQTVVERRRIAGYLASCGERVADVLAPARSHAFAGVPRAFRRLAITLHVRLRQERQFDAVSPILVAARIRHVGSDDQQWLVLVTMLEALLRLPGDLDTIDRRRLSWYGQQLFRSWLEPGEVAKLVHGRWLERASGRELQTWWDLVPDRRPFVTAPMLAELVGHTCTRQRGEDSDHPGCS